MTTSPVPERPRRLATHYLPTCPTLALVEIAPWRVRAHHIAFRAPDSRAVNVFQGQGVSSQPGISSGGSTSPERKTFKVDELISIKEGPLMSYSARVIE
jgi:hypothetical protein